MSTIPGGTTLSISSPASSIVAKPRAHGAASSIAKSFEPSAANNLTAKRLSLVGKAVPGAGFRSLSNTASRHKSAGMSPVKAVSKDILTGTEKATVALNGSLLLSKKSILDVQDLGASLVDKALELLNVDITLTSTASTKRPKLSAKSKLEKVPLTDPTASSVSEDEQYTVTFDVPEDFGEVGAFQSWNPNPDKFYLHYMTLVFPDKTPIQFPCNPWVFNQTKYSTPRVFFSNKTYLPSATPPGLQAVRESELTILRGNGEGERKDQDRVYDYDVYNDLGIPDVTPSSKRAPMGRSKEFPYPRRIRTRRPHNISEYQAECNTGASWVFDGP